jgi:O-antigen ligase
VKLTLALAAAFVAGLLLYWFTGTVGLVVAGAVLVWLFPFTGRVPRFDGLPVVPAVAYIVLLLVIMFFSVDSERSVPAVLWQLLLGSLAVAVVTLVRSDGDRRAMLRAMAIGSLVVMAPNVIEWVRAGAPLLWRVTYDHNNGIALFNIIFIAALATGELKNKLWWPWLAAFAWLCWFSGSRGAALGLAVSIAVWAFQSFKGRWVPVAFSPLAALLGVAASAFDNGRLFSMSDRSQYWGVALDMFKRSPLTGTGSDTFNGFYNAAYPDRVSYNFNHAHNLPLSTLAEGGLIAFAAALWLVVEVVRGLLRRAGSPWAVGALAMLVGLLVHSMLDVPTSSAYVATAAVVVVAMGLGTDVA